MRTWLLVGVLGALVAPFLALVVGIAALLAFPFFLLVLVIVATMTALVGFGAVLAAAILALTAMERERINRAHRRAASPQHWG